MSYLLVGLGNPGEKYKKTRHNAGKMFIRWINEGRRTKDKGRRNFDAIESECFMNESGGWIKNDLRFTIYDLRNLFIIHDDLDIPLGKFKIQFGKGPRLHNGVLSVEQALGTKEFWRIRIGIENRSTGQQADRLTGYQASRLKNEDSGEDYVLEGFTPEEKKILVSVFPEIRDRLLKKVQPFKAKNVVL